MKKILILLLIPFFITIVGAADFSYTINESQGFNKNETVTINYLENKTLNIAYGTYTTGSVNQIFFNNTNSSDIDIQINVPNSILVGNYIDDVWFTNDADSFSTKISFEIIVIPYNNTIINTTNITNNITTNLSEYILIDYNHFEYTLCDYVIPWTSTKEVVIRGREGQIIYTNYDTNFFSVPLSITIPPANYSPVNVLINLSNLSVGRYTRQVNFSVVSNSSFVTFDFNILSCIRPAPGYDDMIKVCSIVNKTAADVLQCQKLQAEYNKYLYDALLSIEGNHTINNTIKEYVNITERVPVLDLGNPEVVAALKNIPVTWKQMITDQNQKAKQIDELTKNLNEFKQNYTDEVKKMRDDSEKRITNSLIVMSQDAITKQNEIDKYKQDYLKKTIIWRWIFTGIGITLCAGFYIWYDANNFW